MWGYLTLLTSCFINFNNEIRKILTNKNEIFKQYITNGKSQTDYERLQLISNNNVIKTIKSYLVYKLYLKNSQSGFRPNNSCVNQLISITNNIYRTFDAYSSLEVRGVFLDLLKEIDKVWHESLLYKV